MRRRTFLEGSSLGLTGLLTAGWGERAARAYTTASPDPQPGKLRELKADLVIIGGGLGGCAAALAALRHGQSVVMTEPTDWIGGQVTQQGVPPDEHPWIERFGANASYLEFRRRIRTYYKDNYPLTPEAAARPFLNPGNGSVSRLCHEPRVALAVLTAMLAPYASAGKLTVLFEHTPTAADVQSDVVKSVTVRDIRTGHQRTLIAPYFLDATEMGDLLPLAKAEYVVGFESKAETGDLKAPEQAQPSNHQSFTCCFAMDYVPGADHTIDRPAEYGFWRDYVPQLTPAWPGKIFGDGTHPVTLQPRKFEFDPEGPGAGFWVYRRIVDARNFQAGLFPGGMTLVNWPQNDYWLGNLIDVPEAEAAGHLARAKQLSLSLLYWLQTEFSRPDGKSGYPGLRLRPDVLGTSDGLAKHPYIRESRRIQAEFTVREEHVGTDARRTKLGNQEVAAELFADSVGVGSYRIDLHPSSGGDNYIDVSSLPFQIPLGSLIPRRVENLLPACKNLGVTHITNGCYRLHPVEWGIGEAAGALVSFCLGRKTTPRAVRNTPKLLSEFQAFITNQGFEIAWPDVATSPR